MFSKKSTNSILIFALAISTLYFGTRNESFWPSFSLYLVVGLVALAFAFKLFFLFKSNQRVQMRQSLWVAGGMLGVLALLYFFA